MLKALAMIATHTMAFIIGGVFMFIGFAIAIAANPQLGDCVDKVLPK